LAGFQCDLMTTRYSCLLFLGHPVRTVAACVYVDRQYRAAYAISVSLLTKMCSLQLAVKTIYLLNGLALFAISD